MYTSFMQVTPCAIIIKIEAPWRFASTDYAEACTLYRNSPVPGYPEGNAPTLLTVHHYNREIRAEAIRRCATRLIQIVLAEKGIRAVGPLVILQARFEPGSKFHCTVELMLRPNVASRDEEQCSASTETGDVRIEATRESLLIEAVRDHLGSCDSFIAAA